MIPTRIKYVHPNVNLNVNNNDSVNTINCTLISDCSNFEKSLECSFVDSFSEGIIILWLNCCGLKRRLNYPEFESLIKHYDILYFLRIKLMT